MTLSKTRVAYTHSNIGILQNSQVSKLKASHLFNTSFSFPDCETYMHQRTETNESLQKKESKPRLPVCNLTQRYWDLPDHL